MDKEKGEQFTAALLLLMRGAEAEGMSAEDCVEVLDRVTQAIYDTIDLGSSEAHLN